MDSISRFQSLLSEIFQFETSDLDFGIYRILNYKRDQIEKFIKGDIKNIVEIAFSKHKDERLLNISQKFEDARKKVFETLGSAVLTPSGDLKAEFRDTPVGKEFLLLKEQKDLAGKIDEIKLQVFNDLYAFFSRYYEKGDFVPQYRHSIKNFRCAIPYNGEEVKLYWANEGQYYTKTGILFRDFAFFSDPGKTYKIIFRTVSAREELSSNKATKARFFVLDDERPICHPEFISGSQEIPKPVRYDTKELIIRFQYRELTNKEVKLFDVEGGSNTARQEKINQKIFDGIIKQIKDLTLKAFLSAEYKNEKPLLLYQTSRFTAKNTKDYFIHKNLRKFLTEQLDYFIKAEVLSIETLENEPFLDKHTTRAKVVRDVGEKIIDFLSQIEDFQKKLWEKKKFVLKTDYVITTDRVPEEFYDEVLKNKAQLEEWGELGSLKYFLEFETQDSPNFLAIEHLKDPFSYKLKVNFEEMGEPAEAVVDIPETFNYLLGLKMKKIKAREIAVPSARKDKKRKYLFILGEKEGVNIAVVWRKVDDNWDEGDFRKDKQFILKELKAWMPQRIYINGQSILTTNLEEHPVEIHYIEPEFKTLMFS